MSRPGRRSWCCGSPINGPHREGCPYQPVGPLDYDAPAELADDLSPDPLGFAPGTEFLVEWEMPPANVAAYEWEDRYGRGVWPKLPREQWDGLPWRAAAGVVTEDYEQALGQYRQLKRWADSHEQPIRNVRLSARKPPEWSEVVGIPPEGLPNPAPHLAGDWLGEPQPRGGRYA